MKTKKELKSGSKQIPVVAYDRTCGYYAPIQNVNKGKAAEIALRKRVNVSEALKKKLMRG